MPAIAPPDREALREAGDVAVADVEANVEVGVVEGVDVDVVLAKFELGVVEEGDIVRGVAVYIVVE